MIFNLIGSLGLFLIGMWLMTEGLKLAGGQALKTLLSQWTSSRPRGLATGIFITALVQSSSAVTVATIGFVNAGLQTFQQALWVVFGSNVGTTFTAWIVTFFGFSVDIDAFAFPLIGVGAALHVMFPYDRGKSFGMALAGFGLLFMGIDALKDNFSIYAQQMDIVSVFEQSKFPTLLGLGIGFILTLLTQSSSAAIAIILTAVATGVAGIHTAAAAVIGANIGTTSTALLATIGATANAKRLAWAHVAFNILTAVIALLLLPVFMLIIDAITNMAKITGNIMLSLSIFHTFFNVIGVIVMWPIEPRLSKFLLTLYQKPHAQQIESALDANIATIPDLAIKAMITELDYLTEAVGKINFPTPEIPTNIKNIALLKQRIEDLIAFISLTSKSNLTKEQSKVLTSGLEVNHYLKNAFATLVAAEDEHYSIAQSPIVVRQMLNEWLIAVNEFNELVYHSDEELQEKYMSELKERYHYLKKRLLEATVAEKINIQTVDSALQIASLSRRYVEQLIQAGDAFHAIVDIDSKPSDEASSKLTETEDENIKDFTNTNNSD